MCLCDHAQCGALETVDPRSKKIVANRGGRDPCIKHQRPVTSFAMIRIQRLHRMTIALGAAMYACGGNPTTSTPVSGVCRNYASSVTSTTTTTNTFPFVITSTQNITSSYNTATNQLSATGTATSSLGCQYSGSWSTNYGSVADFIDEVSVVPPKTRWATQSATVTANGPSGPCANGTFTRTTTNSYDSQGRLVSRVSTGLGATFPGIEGISDTRLYGLGPFWSANCLPPFAPEMGDFVR